MYLALFGLPAMYLLELEVHEAALITLMIFIPRAMTVYIAAPAFPEVFR